MFMSARVNEAGAIDADYTRTAFGTWRITVTSSAGTDVVNGSGELPEVVEDAVMPVVQEHTDRLGGPCTTIHTLDGDTSAFMAAYEAAQARREF